MAVTGLKAALGVTSAWVEIEDVSTYVERVTKNNPIPAKITGADFTPVLAPKK